MAEKQLRTRFSLRRDLLQNFDPSFIPLKGELIFVDTEDNKIRLKVGDGSTTFSNLKYLDQEEVINIVAGAGIDISINSEGKYVISSSVTSLEWGNITGDIINQEDLYNLLNSKQDELVPGGGIEIKDNVISVNLEDWIIFDCGDSVSDINNYEIDSEGNVTIVTYWGTIKGEIDMQKDLKFRLKEIESAELTPQEIEKILYLG